jgi:hypothetical protein
MKLPPEFAMEFTSASGNHHVGLNTLGLLGPEARLRVGGGPAQVIPFLPQQREYAAAFGEQAHRVWRPTTTGSAVDSDGNGRADVMKVRFVEDDRAFQITARANPFTGSWVNGSSVAVSDVTDASHPHLLQERRVDHDRRHEPMTLAGGVVSIDESDLVLTNQCYVDVLGSDPGVMCGDMPDSSLQVTYRSGDESIRLDSSTEPRGLPQITESYSHTAMGTLTFSRTSAPFWLHMLHDL